MIRLTYSTVFKKFECHNVYYYEIEYFDNKPIELRYSLNDNVMNKIKYSELIYLEINGEILVDIEDCIRSVKYKRDGEFDLSFLDDIEKKGEIDDNKLDKFIKKHVIDKKK